MIERGRALCKEGPMHRSVGIRIMGEGSSMGWQFAT
jgi:hypothetical protein